MLGQVMASRLIRSGQSNRPSSPSKDKAVALQFKWASNAMDYSNIGIPSSRHTGRHPRQTGSPIGRLLPPAEVQLAYSRAPLTGRESF